MELSLVGGAYVSLMRAIKARNRWRRRDEILESNQELNANV